MTNTSLGLLLAICHVIIIIPNFKGASCLVMLLKFDGSLRPPRDFYNFCSPDGSQKLASCSATISLQSSDGLGEERMIAIGGKYISNEPFMTSADTE